MDLDLIGINFVDKIDEIYGGGATKYEPSEQATGVIGLLPFMQIGPESIKKTNFLYHLKSAKYIDHLIFSIFLKFGNDGA